METEASQKTVENKEEIKTVATETATVNHHSIYIQARRILIVLGVIFLLLLIILALYLNGKSIYEGGL